MNHLWTVKQGDKELGTVEAITRKGACHEAYDKFGIEQSKRNTITVEKVAHGGFYIPESRRAFGDVVCNFNPEFDRRLIAVDPGLKDSTVEVLIKDGQITGIRSLD